MLLFKYLVLFFVFFTLYGCSITGPKAKGETLSFQETMQNDDSDDELFDDFEEELEIEEIHDPFNSYNRVMTSLNDSLYEYLFIPIAKGYNRVLHEEIRKSISNFFKNLYFPVRVTNNILQGKLTNASEETGRFLINSSIGLLGLFDPAKSQFNLYEHNEDFGQTLGFYGVGPGAHIVLPLFGPSNIRDSISLIPDSFLSPIDYRTREWPTLTDSINEYVLINSFETINDTSLNVESYEKLKEDSIDLYPYLREIYEQHRAKQIEE